MENFFFVFQAEPYPALAFIRYCYIAATRAYTIRTDCLHGSIIDIACGTGSALMWFNLDFASTPLALAPHVVCPLLKWVKWSYVTFIHNVPTEPRFPAYNSTAELYAKHSADIENSYDCDDKVPNCAALIASGISDCLHYPGNLLLGAFYMIHIPLLF